MVRLEPFGDVAEHDVGVRHPRGIAKGCSYEPWIGAFITILWHMITIRLGLHSRTVLVDMGMNHYRCQLYVGQQRSHLCFISVPRNHLVRYESALEDSIVVIEKMPAEDVISSSKNDFICWRQASLTKQNNLSHLGTRVESHLLENPRRGAYLFGIC